MQPEDVPSTQKVSDAVRELYELGQTVTRHTVAELTGLKMSVVDDRLRALVDDGKLRRLVRGVYKPVEQYPEPRPMFFGLMTDGFVKLEVGDDVLTLTPAEARRIARAMGGFAEDARVLESTQRHLFLAQEVASELAQQRNTLNRLVAGLGGLP